MKFILLSLILLAPQASKADPFNPQRLKAICKQPNDEYHYDSVLTVFYDTTEIAQNENAIYTTDPGNVRAKRCAERERFINAKILSAVNQNKYIDIDLRVDARFYETIKEVDPLNNDKTRAAEIERRMKERGDVKCEFAPNGYARRKANFPGCGYDSALAIRDVICKDELGGSVETRAMCSVKAEKKGATACFAESISYDVVQLPEPGNNNSSNSQNSRSAE